MKYFISCIVAAAMVAGIGFGVDWGSEDASSETKKQEIVSETSGLLEEDASFETDNPIVYDALLQLDASLEKLNMLERNGVDVGTAKKDVQALIEFVRETGKKQKVEKIEIPGQTLNNVEMVVYNADREKGGQVATAAGIASFKELVSGDDASKYEADGTEQNAIKHVKWSAVAVIFTKDASYTKYFTDAHEFGHPANFNDAQTFADSDMDLKNNALGREIGEKLYPQGKLTALNQLNNEIEKVKTQGRLTVIK